MDNLEQHPASRIEDFDGVVNVTFSDAIIASSSRAKVFLEAGTAPVFFIPFEDVYFELLTKTSDVHHDPELGNASLWSVSAVGSAADAFMMSFEEGGLAQHATFDPKIARIAALPSDDRGNPTADVDTDA